MKNISFFVILSLIFFSFPLFVFAADSGYVTHKIPVDLDLDNAIQNISIDFCQKGQDNAFINIYPGFVNEKCIKISNSSSMKLPLLMNVVDLGLTNKGNVTCNSSLKINSFSKSILVDPSIQEFTLPAHSYITYNVPFFVPSGYTGDLRGCLVYTLQDNIKESGKVFNVVVYKTKMFELYIQNKSFFMDIWMSILKYKNILLISFVFICFSLLFFSFLFSRFNKKNSH